jgi:hypothetical protein
MGVRRLGNQTRRHTGRQISDVERIGRTDTAAGGDPLRGVRDGQAACRFDVVEAG